MAHVTVTFTLSETSLPSFKFDPDPVPISAKTETIYWTQGSNNFSFAALAFDDKNPFSNVVVQPTQISADDNNQEKRDHHYAVLVEANGVYYSSEDCGKTGGPGPTIRNK
jgi:hypothetical protein